MARPKGSKNRKLTEAERARLLERLKLHADAGDLLAAGVLLVVDHITHERNRHATGS